MKFDLIVIGGGSAGHSAARTAASLGLSCALVEAPGELGGLCILRGCMPSKTLIETANRMREIRETERFGIDVGAPKLDLGKLRDRLHVLTKDFRDHRQKEMLEASYQLIRGTAAFESPYKLTVTLDGEVSTLEAKAFVIATGSTPQIPDIEGLRNTPFWTSDDLVTLPAPPKEVVVLGGGAIAMEAAHMLEGFGSKVTVVIRKQHILSHADQDVARAIEAESLERGIVFLRETEFASVSHSKGKFHIQLKGDKPAITTEALLIAAGRTPNTKNIGLNKIGIAMDGGLILIDDRCATSISHIFAAGDCASPVPVVHLAVIQGETAAKNAERIINDGHSELSAEWPRESAMLGLFTEPQCVEIGLSEKKAAENGIAVITGKVEYNDQGKGMIAGSRHGFVKIIAEKESRRIVGAAAAGPQVLETSHIVQLAIVQEMTLEDYVTVPHYHPTLTEAWSSAAQVAIDSM